MRKIILVLTILMTACSLGEINPSPLSDPIQTDSTLQAGANPDNSFAGSADIIFFNGVVLTMNTAFPMAEAVAIRGNTIVAVGSNDTVLQLQSENTTVVDLGGLTLMPGFVDTHSHIIQSTQGIQEEYAGLQYEAFRTGITTETEIYMTPEVLSNFQSYEDAGLVKLRWNAYFLYNSNCGDPLDHTWYQTYNQGENITPHMRMQGVKLFTDGGSCKIPAVTFEYKGGYGHGDLFLSQEELNSVVKEVDSNGYQLAMHALGDRAVEEVQNALAALLNGKPNVRRHRIEHNAIINDTLLPRYNEIGIVPTLFGSYATCLRTDPNSRFKYVVPDELGQMEWPWRALLDANPGLIAAWHADYPVFPNLAPMAHLYGFVTRDQVAADGRVCVAPDWLKQGSITVDEALHIMTINSAYALFRENEIGSIEEGKLADMIILSDNPLEVPPETINDIQVFMTMLDGRVEYCLDGYEDYCPESNGSPVVTVSSPIGYIDIPVENESLSGAIEIDGWALDENGIDHIEVYVDGQFVANATYGIPRPDVDADYPGRVNAPNFGYRYLLDTTSLENGNHTIQIKAINRDGASGYMMPESVLVIIEN